MTTQPTMQSLAAEMAQALERATRDDGSTFVKLRDGSPEWMHDVAHAAHDDMMPDDWRYSFLEDACECIAEDEDEGDQRDSMSTGVSVYNADLLQWLSSNLSRPGYCDAAVEEWGSEPDSIMTHIQLGQGFEREEVLGLVREALSERLEELENEDEDEDDDDEGSLS